MAYVNMSVGIALMEGHSNLQEECKEARELLDKHFPGIIEKQGIVCKLN